MEIKTNTIPEEMKGIGITGSVDMKIYHITAPQFVTINERIKGLFDQLREEGVISEEVIFDVKAVGQNADLLLDDFDRFNRRLQALDAAINGGAITTQDYVAEMKGLIERVEQFVEGNKFAMGMIDKHDISTDEGFAAATQEAKDTLDAKAATHFSPEQQAAE
jgi:hypothetical protein